VQAARGRLTGLSTVANVIVGVSGRAMLEALIVGQRDPKALAELARGRMRGKRAALVQALTGRFDDHHAELARVLLDHIDALTAQIDRLTARIEELIAAVPLPSHPPTSPGSATGAAVATPPARALTPKRRRSRSPRPIASMRSPASAARPPR
jgi:transposase